MRKAKQISVSLVNKPGRLSAVLTAMNKEKVNLLALTVMDSGERGTLRMVPDDVALAKSALETINVRFEVADVLLADVPNRPGGFRKICERLANEHLNIDYTYCSFAPAKGGKQGPIAVVKVNDLAKAQRVLSESSGGNGARRRLPRRRPTVR